MRLTSLLLILFLTACETTTFSACPEVRVYSPEEQDKAYVELSQMPSDSTLKAWIVDYKQLRQESKDCKGGKE